MASDFNRKRNGEVRARPGGMLTPVPHPPSLSELAECARGGDRAATGALARAAMPFVARLARRLTAHPTDAEEVTQEVLYVALRHLGQFARRAPFEHWLAALTRSQVSRLHRRARPIPESAVVALPEPSDDLAFEHAVQAHRDVEDALAILSPFDRDVVVGCDLEGRSTREIAERLRLSVAAIRSRLHRAHEAMRHHMHPAMRAPAC